MLRTVALPLFHRRCCAFPAAASAARRPLSTATAEGQGGGRFQRFLCSAREKIGSEQRISYIVHFGNLLAVAAMGSDDMLSLRTFMIGASASGIMYNLLQPKPLFAPACWGIFFIAGHSVQIARLLLERQPVAMSREQHDLYAEHFLPYGFTPRTFLDLLRESHAEEVFVAPGKLLVEEGREIDSIFLLLDGQVDFVHLHHSARSHSEGASAKEEEDDDDDDNDQGDDVELTVALDEVRSHKGVWVGDALSLQERSTPAAGAATATTTAAAATTAAASTWKWSVRAAQVPPQQPSSLSSSSPSSPSPSSSGGGGPSSSGAGVRAMRFTAAGFHRVLLESPAAAAAAERLHIDDLQSKLRSSARSHLSTEHKQRKRIRELSKEVGRLNREMRPKPASIWGEFG